MSETAETAETAFAEIATALAGEPGVSEGTGFGQNPGLRVGGKIFAMLAHGEFVAKLPAPRCQQLIAAGGSRAFDAGKGRPMREWVVVDPGAADWTALAREALAFVGD